MFNNSQTNGKGKSKRTIKVPCSLLMKRGDECCMATALGCHHGPHSSRWELYNLLTAVVVHAPLKSPHFIL